MIKFLTKYFKYFLLALLIYMPVFGHLDRLPIRVWDEARPAMNAYEMLIDGDCIVTHFNGNPDMWSTKPPLLIWFQVAFMKMIGVNELAVRLPSAIAAFLTCMALLFFSLRYLKSYWFGFIAIMVLITSYGYINPHASRTGDYDALLTLFTSISGLFFFIYCENPKNKYIYLFFTTMALAILSKSISGLLFVPALILYSIIQKRFLSLLKNKHFYIGLFGFIAVVASYYLLREANNPGYLAAVRVNELGNRYLGVIENHQHEFGYYYHNIVNYRLSDWHILIPIGFIIGLLSKNRIICRLTVFTSLMILTYFLVISTAQTKLEWYDVPLYPYFSILVAIIISYVFEKSKELNLRIITPKYQWFPFLLLFLIFFAPYQKIFDKTYLPKELEAEKDFYEIGYYLKGAIKGKYDVNGQYLAYDGYNLHNLFYLKILNDKGVQLSFKDWANLKNEDIVIAHQLNVKQFIEENYHNEVISEEGNVLTFRILERKK